MGKMKETLHPETEAYDADKVLAQALLTSLNNLAHELTILTDLVEEVVLGRVEGTSPM